MICYQLFNFPNILVSDMCDHY
ncbi:hypothetical protein BDE02_05G182400 [Populus trichocarpa]|nr:hypothetical protein BDE02_05G182400 [Populus trichocarpa]